ncbi:MAG: hypothetical protein LBU14_03145 [Candidatus Peribacteria bacterium]|nr:hypothetical protein [Candidatus Peribacteria bacterium]
MILIVTVLAPYIFQPWFGCKVILLLPVVKSYFVLKVTGPLNTCIAPKFIESGNWTILSVHCAYSVSLAVGVYVAQAFHLFVPQLVAVYHQLNV